MQLPRDSRYRAAFISSPPGLTRWSMLKCSSAWIAGSSPTMPNTKSFSRRTCVRVVLTTTHQKIRHPAKKPREAERRKTHSANVTPRHQMLPPESASGAVPPPNAPPHAGEGGEGARLPALHRGARQSDRTLRLSPGRASRKGEGAGVTRAVDRA